MTNQQRHKILLLSLPAPFTPDTPLFPLGIGYLAAAMQLDRPVRSVHYRQFEDARKEVPRLIEDWQPEIVGLTCSTFNRGAVKRVCQWVRMAYPDIKVIVGGVHASFMYEQILRDFGANFVVIGEGELTLRELCTACEAGTSPRDVNGIAFLEGDQLIVTPRREPVADLDELAVPDYSFAAELMRTTGMGFLISSRGCPVQCTFCSTSSYWGQRVRTNSPKRIVDEMELLIRNYGVKRIFFHDDTFNLGLNRVRQICHEITNRGLQIEWGVSCRVTPVSEEMLDLMVSSGCRHICWGIESGSEKILAGINKKISLQQIRQAFELCQKHIGTISVGAFVMVGNPGESEETIKETVEFLDSLPMTDPPSTSLLYILPGTALYSTLPQILPAIESYWADCDEVPLYTLEQSVETLVSWHELVSSSGKLMPFEGKQHFWSGIHMHQQEELPPSELDRIIQPEIKDDELYRLITELAMQPDITTALEIGSSAGGGSTEAFVSGLKNNPAAPQLFCMEVSRPRYTALQERYQDEPFVHCYNASSLPISCFPSEREVEVFYNFIPTTLNQYPLSQVLGWLRQDIDYIRKTDAPQNGIELIKQQHDIANFSMVLIDGSEFLGKAELDVVYGATLILLDDINGFKNHHNRKRLLADPAYELIRENLELRNGYSVFRKKDHPQLPVHFFTIVLNGEPFIRHHIDAFRKLSFEWHWHIMEGVADLVHDTAWSLPNGGRITDELHRDGLSNDGTSDYLDELAAQYPEQITIYRKPAGQFWNGKLEMVNAPLPNLPAECLLWQVDSDELWTPEAIEELRSLFISHPEKTAAYCYCDYFVGPNKFVCTLNSWATYPAEWLRVWRYADGMRWAAHEPPTLVDQTGRDLASCAPISRDETVRAGVTFQHFAYTLESQVRFKEIYYGYQNAVANWQRLQQTSGPVRVADYLPWALPDAKVDDWPAEAAPHLATRFIPVPAAGRYVSMSVHGATRFEHELRALFKEIRPQSVIETGTFLGRGTTSIIWRAVRDLGLNTYITTIEVNPEHHRQACDYFAENRMTVRAELGLSIPRNKLPDLTTINDSFVANADTRNGQIYYDHDETERAQLYFGETAFNVPDNLLEAALKRCNYHPDFVLLDSAGHIGLAEFHHLLTLLQGDCHLMLDDINHCKHAATMQEIRRDPRFEILVESDEKFGFAVIRYRHIKRLLYLRTDAIGDSILSAGMLPHIKQRYPGATITVVCQDRTAPLYDACPAVDAVIPFDLIRLFTMPDYRTLVIDKINRTKPDLILNPIYSHDLHDEFLVHHIQAPLKVTIEGDCSNRSSEKLAEMRDLYSRVIANSPNDRTELDHNRTFLHGIGIDAPPLMPQVWISPQDQQWADSTLHELSIAHGTAIILFPGALLDYKTYPHYRQVLAGLHDYPLIVCGGVELQQQADQLCRVHGGQAANLAGQTTLGQLAALMQRARLYLGSDSSGFHIACAVGLRNVVVLGGAHFGRFCPYSPLTTVACLPLNCYGCNWQCSHKRVHCLHDLEPDCVLSAIHSALDQTVLPDLPVLHLQQKATAVDTPAIMNADSLKTAGLLGSARLVIAGNL
jgi:radical SAM superfamily enzyme YgiQ (UPF0313 family)/ADP-heptose:LPS heptosyltransferase